MIKNSVKFHFFGKNCLIDRALSNFGEFEREITKLGFNYNYNPLFLNQVHGNQVIVIDDISKIYQSPFPKADALITNIKNLPICVITADCAPIIFYDEDKEIVAVAHAGWKGAKSGIIENTVKEVKNLGANINNIKTIIGALIHQKSYEVSQEFFDNFLQDDNENEKFFIKAKKPNHFMFDLPAYCIMRINNAGIRQILNQKIDTYSNEENWFSYRRSTHRNEADCGRNISVIALS